MRKASRDGVASTQAANTRLCLRLLASETVRPSIQQEDSKLESVVNFCETGVLLLWNRDSGPSLYSNAAKSPKNH